ncbi:hypothetical protein O1611_g10314 [Lasiodiplodia mahajangana]|uniref:Uncharacterized protein n=1 Tax=Lasiodiplodia mahajangana TaxID=1108764 RepID=A0ACC2IZP0_9PEZI|nr:hypothetical protein O1611_g10314 [Lasiodiplodia mahajangana]
MSTSPTNWSVYTPLTGDEIRLLTLQYVPEADNDEAPPISCELETIALNVIVQQGLQGEPEPAGDNQWPGFYETQPDFAALFKPKRRHKLIGAPERSWKKYVEALDEEIAQHSPVEASATGASHSLSHKYIALSYATPRAAEVPMGSTRCSPMDRCIMYQPGGSRRA